MKKRILHILNSRSYSGAENVVFSIIQHLDEYEFAYVSRKGEIQKRLEKQGIQYYLVDKLTIGEIRKCVTDFKPNIIHAHDFTASVLSCFACHEIPIISHLHNNPPWIKKRGMKSITYCLMIRRFNRILAVSNAVFLEYVFGKRLLNKAKVIYNPIDLDNIRKMAEQECVKKYDIIDLGRLSEVKNPKLFVDIIEECVKKTQVKAAMIGSGELFDEVKLYIHKRNMEKYIDLLGFKDNPYSYLQQSKILCIPSLWEGFGMAAVEALVLAKPVVASNVGGLADIINNSCGKTCNSKNEYVEEIIQLLLDKEYYEKKSIAALKRVESLNKKIDYYNNLKQVYQELF